MKTQGISLSLSKKNLPAQVPSAESLQLQSLCPISRVTRSGFVTRFLLASSGQLSLRVTIAEPVSTREIQIRGLKTFKMLFYIYLYLFVRAFIPITDFFISTRPQLPIFCLVLLQLSAGFLLESQNLAAKSPHKTSITHLLRSCTSPK